MALQNILSAIVAETEKNIAEANALQKQRVKELKDAKEKELSATLKHLAHEKEHKKADMRLRVEGQARMQFRHAVLHRKQELLDRLYGEVASELSSLSDADAAAWLTERLESLPEGGALRPAKRHEALVKKIAGKRFDVGEPIDAAGGFRLETEDAVYDYTFDFLVTQLLRPETELDVAKELFADR